MNVTAYIHPERLLVCAWAIEDSVPVIHAYKEVDPTSEISFQELGYNNVHLIIHSSDVRLHWYPAVDHIQAAEQHAFEQSAWFTADGYRGLSATAFTTVIHANAGPMHASVQVRSPLISRIEQLSTGARVSVDTDLDIQAALTSTMPRQSPWLLVGRRGSMWQATIIGSDHQPIASSAFAHDTDYSYESMVALIHTTLQDRYCLTLEAIMLYGDIVTSEQIQSIRESTVFSGVKIARSQPFKLVRSMLSQEVEQRLLRRAHVVAPLAGSMFRSTIADS